MSEWHKHNIKCNNCQYEWLGMCRDDTLVFECPNCAEMSGEKIKYIEKNIKKISTVFYIFLIILFTATKNYSSSILSVYLLMREIKNLNK